MALKAPDADNMVKGLIVALIFLFFISQFINFGAIGSDDEDVSIFKDPGDVGDLTNLAFRYILIGAAVWFAWNVIGGFSGGRLDRKKFVTLVVAGVALWLLYDKFLVVQWPEIFKPTAQTAAVLQMKTQAIIQSIIP